MGLRLGTLECINIIRHDYYNREISEIIKGKVNILIVGGGYGDSLEDYCSSDLKITFTDIELDAVEYARKKFADYNVEFQCCSAYNLPFKDNAFDLVVSTLNGSYLNRKALKEFNRVMNQDAILILSETTIEYVDYLRKIGRYNGKYILGSDMKTKISHLYVYEKEELESVCCNCGFSPTHYKILRPNNLISQDEISSVIINFSKCLGIEIADVPLLYYLILRKEYKYEEDQ